MKTILEQFDNPYAAPQAELTPEFSAANRTHKNIAVREKIFFVCMKAGFYVGVLLCSLFFVILLVDLVQLEWTRRLDRVGFFILLSLLMLGFFSLLGGLAGIILMTLDVLMQMVGICEPPLPEVTANWEQHVPNANRNPGNDDGYYESRD